MIKFYCCEFKFRIFYLILSLSLSICVFSFYVTELLYLYIKPFCKLFSFDFIYTDVSSLFLVTLLAIVIIAIFIHLPLIIYQLMLFSWPGLYKYERQIISCITISLLIIYYLSFYFLYCYLTPLVFNFFFVFDNVFNTFSTVFSVKMQLLFSNFCLTLFYFYLCFSLLFFLCLFSFSYLIRQQASLSSGMKYRKFIYLFFLCFSAVITPPDIFTQLLSTIFLILFIEIVVFFYFVCNYYFLV